MKRQLTIALVLAAAAVICTGCQNGQRADSPDMSPLQRLTTGNERFVSGQAAHMHADANTRRDTAKHGQHPFATVVACSDSRVPVELLFDQGIGDIFVIRVAGNVCAADESGSIEYAVGHLDTPLLVVLGHTGCGAVTAAVQGAEAHGSIPELLAHISPAVEAARRQHPNLKGDNLVATSVRCNVWHSIEDLIGHSAEVRQKLNEGKLDVVGAVYDLDTGLVEWLGAHPRQLELVRSSDEDGWHMGHAVTK